MRIHYAAVLDGSTSRPECPASKPAWSSAGESSNGQPTAATAAARLASGNGRRPWSRPHKRIPTRSAGSFTFSRQHTLPVQHGGLLDP
jgi:hypothetical protein